MARIPIIDLPHVFDPGASAENMRIHRNTLFPLPTTNFYIFQQIIDLYLIIRDILIAIAGSVGDFLADGFRSRIF